MAVKWMGEGVSEEEGGGGRRFGWYRIGMAWCGGACRGREAAVAAKDGTPQLSGARGAGRAN